MSRVLERSFNFGHAAPMSTLGASEARLRTIVLQHFEVLWRFLRRLGIPDHETDDAVQEVVLVLSRKLDSVEVGAERSFLLSTAVRVASTFRRTARNRREVDDSELVQHASPALDPEALAEQRRLRALLDRALNELPLELRAVFVLYELEELTMAEIAVTLGLPPGTVASRLRRSRELFEALAPRVLDNGGFPP